MIISWTICWHFLKVKWNNEPVLRLWTPSFPPFLPFFLLLSMGKQRDHWGGLVLPLSCMPKTTKEQSVIILQCWIWEVFALWICVKPFVDWLENLLTFFFQIIKKKTHNTLLRAPSIIFPIYYHYFWKRALKKSCEKVKCTD